MTPDSAIERLAEVLPGRVGRPGSALWTSGRTVFAPAARERRPAAIVRPRNRRDVAAVLRWATDTQTRVLVRSGGHSLDGFSVQEGVVVVDLRDLHRVDVLEPGFIRVMPATTVLDVARALAPLGHALPSGECPTVGMAGLTSGGGFGYSARHFGLTLDAMVEATIALPNGELYDVSALEHPELFWACRGGAGCAGLITDMTLKTAPLGRVTVLESDWRWDACAEVVSFFSAFILRTTTELDLKLKIRTTGPDRFIDMSRSGPEGVEPGTPSVHIAGQCLRSLDETRELLTPLLTHEALVSYRLREESYHDAVLELTPFDLFEDPAPAMIRPIRVASDFGHGAPNEDQADAIVRFVASMQYRPDLHGGAALIEPCDGAIARVDREATCFAQRGADLVYQWQLFHELPYSSEIIRRHDALLSETRHELAGLLTGGRYLNYPDRLDTPEHWWGGNLPRLATIVDAVDPNHIVVSRLHPAASRPERRRARRTDT